MRDDNAIRFGWKGVVELQNQAAMVLPVAVERTRKSRSL